MNELVDEFSLVREILNKPILSSEEEKRLGKQKDLKIGKTIERVEILIEAKREEIRKRAEELREKLRKLEKRKKEARGKLIERNQRLVLDMANRFSKGNRKLVPDFFQDGNIGLIRAVEKFDDSFGCKFSTYATWWIRQAMQRGKENTYNEVQLTNYLRKRLACYIRVFNEFSEKPSIKAIAKKMNLARDMVFFLSTLYQKHISLDHPVKDEIDMKSFANIFSLNDDDIEENLHIKQLIEKIFKISRDICNDIDTRIIKMRFGIDCEEHTLKGAGKKVGLSKERIRQRQNKFLETMREELEGVQI